MKTKRTHVRLFWLEYNRYIPRAIQVRMKSETPDESHARGKFCPLKIDTSHFWRETKMNTLQARLIDLSRLRRSLGRFARLFNS